MKSGEILKGLSVAILSALLVSAVVADEVEILAEFVPDPSNPGANRFINKTPPSGYCAIYPTVCAQQNIFSIETNIIAAANAPIRANHGLRQGPMFQIPSHWTEVQVVHAEGDSETLQYRVRSIGGNYRLDRPVQELIGQPEGNNSKALGMLWGGVGNNAPLATWMYPPRPCTRTTNAFSLNSYGENFYWNIPAGQVCSKTAAFDIPDFSYTKFDIMYELATPNPLNMKSGTYTGRLPYGVGPGLAFDLGDVMVPSESELAFNFTLTVNHIFKVEIPPGGNKVSLSPEGGWQSWLNQGRRPTRLFRDQTFNIWSSTAFKMQMECEHYAANSTCALQDDKNNQVPVQVSVSLPHGLGDTSGQAVSRRPLRVDGVGTERFEPTLYIDRKPGTLHFEVDKAAVAEMLRGGARQYTGGITVVWDSQI
ncbi:hypothetical protein [Pseudomonas sp. MHK4]|jgi:hypothetical protein